MKEVVPKPCDNCQKAADKPVCFDCSLGDDKETWPYQCHECGGCTDGSEIIDGIVQYVCFACYWKKLNLAYQEKLCKNRT